MSEERLVRDPFEQRPLRRLSADQRWARSAVAPIPADEVEVAEEIAGDEAP